MSRPEERIRDARRAESQRQRPLFPLAVHLGSANLATSAVAVCGLLGLVLAANHVRVALTLLGAATGLDRLDGFLARRLGQESAFGGQLDSLADAVAFCALPATLAVTLGARSPLGLAAAAGFVLCGMWRLAHFNVHGLEAGRGGDLYTGVPTTVVASWLLVAAAPLAHIPAGARSAAWLVITTALALLMICRLPYPKDGPATRILYLLVPAATAVVWLWWP